MTRNVSNLLNLWSRHLCLFSQLCFRSASESKPNGSTSAWARFLLSLSSEPPARGHGQITNSQVSQAKSQVQNLSHLPLTLDLLLHCVPAVPRGFGILYLASSREATFLPVFFNILRCADFGCLLRAHCHIFDFPLYPFAPMIYESKRTKSSQPAAVFFKLKPLHCDGRTSSCQSIVLIQLLSSTSFLRWHLTTTLYTEWPTLLPDQSIFFRLYRYVFTVCLYVYLLILHPKWGICQHPAATVDSPGKVSPQCTQLLELQSLEPFLFTFIISTLCQ